jgi:hypothetical protein
MDTIQPFIPVKNLEFKDQAYQEVNQLNNNDLTERINGVSKTFAPID